MDLFFERMRVPHTLFPNLFSREEVRNPLKEEPKKEKGSEEEETYEDVILIGE